MPEGVGDVANHHALTKEPTDIFPDQQIAHDRFGGDQEFIRQDVPGTDQDPLFLDILLQPRQVCHANLQVVLKHNCLPIQHEMQVIRVIIQDD